MNFKAPQGAFILPEKGERKNKMSSKNIMSIILSSLIFLGVAVLSDAQECTEDNNQINESETTELTEVTDDYEPEKMDLDHNITGYEYADDAIVYESMTEENDDIYDFFQETEIESEEQYIIETESTKEEVILESAANEINDLNPVDVIPATPEESVAMPENKYDYESAPYFENRCVQYLMTDYDIRLLPDPNAEILVSLPAGSSVQVIAMSSFSPWLQVEVEGQIGYVNIMVLNTEKEALDSNELAILDDTETEELWQEII